MHFNTYHPCSGAASTGLPAEWDEINEARLPAFIRQCAELLRENAQLRDEIGILKQRVLDLEVTP
jgi:hypothetical protein